LGFCTTCEKDGGSGKFCVTCGKQMEATVMESAVVEAPNTSAGKGGMWSHLGAILLVIAGYGSFFPWLILWLPAALVRNSRTATEFDKRHATESMNFQFTALALFGIFVVGDIILFTAMVTGVTAAAQLLIYYAIATLIIVILYQWVGVIFAAQASVAAANLREYRYPLSYRFVK